MLYSLKARFVPVIDRDAKRSSHDSSGRSATTPMMLRSRAR
jgi:hypothetical protein